MTSDTAAVRAPRSKKNLVLGAIAAVIAVDVLAFVLVPPPGGESGFAFPKDAITQNLHGVAPHVLFAIPGTDLTITSTILTTWIVMALVFALMFAATRGLRAIPRGAQNLLEYVYESLEGFAMALGGAPGRRYVPLFLGLFLFILASNWSGLIPIVGRVDFLRAPTSDINVTFGLAIVSFLTFHSEGVRQLGLRGYLGKFFTLAGFKRGVFDGVIDFFVGILEFFLEFFKPLTLSLRLFANIYGGELVLGVMTGLLVAVAPVAFLGLELFVGFMQALVFSILTLMFTLIAIEGHHDEEHAPSTEPAPGAVHAVAAPAH